MKKLLLLASLLAAVAGASCHGDDPTPQPCTGIPEGGCPLSHGVACEDPSCVAVYKCLEGNQWELDHVCPAHEGGVKDAAAEAEADASSPFDASIDAPPGAFGGPGCPDLQEPDCPLGNALACGATCCGCEDLYVCANGGWNYWGSCGDAGPTPK